ncbi:spermidine synthase [Streptomyces sp. TRM 70351]|uniref:spermidine synthase n=1 Tax=Streptomyces sp. TRM 70351 TaxID=3116552 RepID=UPI002E7B288A|nr:spermidine synthase [Streptomyces sp. TRM 70351]MEE1930106.1 spermidine synthase [Streptomyces sp. TRM 70351]
MSARFEEIDWRPTPMGEISLRRRREPVSGADVYEVKLGDEFLMSSLFTAGEVALARLGLAELADAPHLDVVVGGLGLGYTAATVLEDRRVRSLLVVEALGEVIGWHRRGLVPLGAGLASDPRCRLVEGSFFTLAGADGFDPGAPGRRFDAILLDIDHAPGHVLHPGHAPFYEPAGLRALTAFLRPGGVFALWSNDPPDERFGRDLAEVFPETAAHVVAFDNPLQGGTATNTVYTARS